MPRDIDLCVSIHEIVCVTVDAVSRVRNQYGHVPQVFKSAATISATSSRKPTLGSQPNLGSCLASVTYEGTHFGRPKIMRVDRNDTLPALIESMFLHAVSAPD